MQKTPKITLSCLQKKSQHQHPSYFSHSFFLKKIRTRTKRKEKKRKKIILIRNRFFVSLVRSNSIVLENSSLCG